MKTDLYLAYGSNLNKEQMSYRCPDALPLIGCVANGWRLVFRGVADITPDKASNLPVGLWRITSECEAALDRYEGYPRLYRKEYITLGAWAGMWRGETAMTYVMNHDSIAPPSQIYLKTIAEGYRDFKLPMTSLQKEVRWSVDNERLFPTGYAK